MNKKLRSLLLSLPLAVTAMYGQTITDSLNFTGGMQTYTVPCGVTSVTITTIGAQGGNGATGGNSSTGGIGGFGSMSTGTLAVTPGQLLYVFVGGAGATPTAGFNGGGTGGSVNAGGGGGASDVRINTTAVADRIIVGSGGGGGGRGGCEPANVNGGNGGNGGANGADGGISPDGGPGFGAIGSAAGAAGIGCNYALGLPGFAAANEVGGNGGDGQSCCCFSFASIPGGGGGGGGFIGGGGGGGGTAGTTGCSGNNKGGGGGGAGGSNYTGGVVSGISLNGVRGGNGVVLISYATPMPAAVTGSGPSSFCVGTNATFVANNDPNTTTFTWTLQSGLTLVSGQGTGTMVFTSAVAGTYTVQVVGSNACFTGPSTSINIVVNPLPTVTATAATPAICLGSADVLTAAGASTYVWSSGGTSDLETVSPTSNSTYTVTGTDVNGCINTATVSVNVNALPVVDLGLDVAVCGGPLTLDAGNAGSTFLWNDASTNQTLSATTTGTYSVTVTDANGCMNSSAVTVTVNPNPTVNANAIPSTTLCAGDTVTAFGTGALTYVWSGGVVDGVPFVPPTGTPSYTVTGTDANGCTGTFVGTLTVNALPVVTATAADNNVCLDDAPVALTGTPVSGTWSGPGVTGSSFNPATAGVGSQSVVYSFTDANGCSNSASTSIDVNSCVGVNEGNILASGITIYPNPTNGIFNINVNANVGDMTIEVVDMEGRIVYSSNEKNVQTGFSKPVSLVGMPNGVYLINLKSASEHATHSVTLTK